jgi:hypothetical protein
MKNKRRRKRKLNYFNILVFISMIISGGLLIHDFIFWGVIPVFSGTFYQLTYFGLFIDVVAIGMLDLSIQYIKEWF